MFLSQPDKTVSVNFLNSYNEKSKLEKRVKCFIPNFFISNRSKVIFKIYHDFNLKSKKYFLNWNLNLVFFRKIPISQRYFFYKNRSCYFKRQFGSRYQVFRKILSLKVLKSICCFIRLISYNITLKKAKKISNKDISIEFLPIVSFFCLNNIFFVTKLTPKISNAKIISKLQKNGSIKLIFRKIKHKHDYFQVKTKFQIYKRKLSSFFGLSKFIFLQ